MLPKTASRLPRSSDDVRRRRSSGRSSAWRWRRHSPLHQSLTISCAPSRDGSRGASRDPVEHSEDTGGHMTTLSLEQAARLTGRGKTILARESLVGYSRETRKAAVLTLMAPSRRESTRSLLLSKQRPSCAPVLPWPRRGCPN